ncbi:hypothetical protein CHISP_0568 [Chitinispirillum alkaliphilum]|nr:hypothetical protein CHISP_0568 [Chitinispirillum alkaliphilum]
MALQNNGNRSIESQSPHTFDKSKPTLQGSGKKTGNSSTVQRKPRAVMERSFRALGEQGSLTRLNVFNYTLYYCHGLENKPSL